MLARLNILVNAEAARRALGAFQRQVASTGRFVQARAGAMAGAFSSVASSIFGLRGAMAGLGLGLLTRSIVGTTLQVERLKIALNSTRQDMDKTTRRFDAMRKMSDELGVDFLTTAGAFKNFGLAAEQAGIQGAETERIFRSFVTAGAAMQMTNEELEGSLTAVAQMFSKGKVSAEELRGQLGERMPVAFGMAAEAMGMTNAQLDKALSLGNIAADDMVPKLATALQEKFGEGAKSAAKSATAQFNRFNNALNDLKVAIGESGLVSALGTLAGKITAFVRSGDLGDWIHSAMMGFAGVLRGVADFNATLTVITGGIGSVFESIRNMYNTVNKFAGGYLVEMGLLGYMLIGGRKGGFIGLIVAILAGVGDKIVRFIHETLKAMMQEAQKLFTTEMPTYDEYARTRTGRNNAYSRQGGAGAYNAAMLARGLTQNADGTFSGVSSLPGAQAMYDSLGSGISAVEKAITDRENGLYGFRAALDTGFDKLYEAVGLTPSAGMGGLPSYTPGSAAGGTPDYRLAEGMEDLADQFKRNADKMRLGETADDFGSLPGAGPKPKQSATKQAIGDFASGAAEAFSNMKVAALDFKQHGLDVVNKGFGFLDSAIDGFISGTKVSFKAFVSDMLAMLAKLLVKMMIFKALGGTKFGDFIGIPAPTQGAGGGGIQAGRPYLVGERGPEMFFPRMGGHMVPNHALAGGGGGGVTINNHYDFSNADDSVAARLNQAAETIKQETFSKVFGAIEHGGRYAKATGRRA
jgi:tape measure domain-containing protein